MRKSIFSFMAFLAFGSFAMANTIELETSNTIEIEKTDLEVKHILIENENCEEEVGKASDCVQWARNFILKSAAEVGWDTSSGSEHYNQLMAAYMAVYKNCLNE